jgi:GDP-mannose 6-dehydrogenase
VIKRSLSVVSVFGLGYIGCVSLGCLAKAGYKVIGVDINQDKVESVSKGSPTVLEPGLDDLYQDAMNRKLLSATCDVQRAVSESEVILITVGTPSQKNGDLDLSNVHAAIEGIAKSLATVDGYRLVVIRSTVKPGTCELLSKKITEISGKKADIDFSVVANPEFLREGTAINDYCNPPYILIGANTDDAAYMVAQLYSGINAPIINTQLNTAEIIKYVNNSWHALKVAFANEIGAICKSLNINSFELMDLFCKDKILNISPYYLKPGFPYGGACLPKDLSGLVSLSKSAGVTAPLLESNDCHIERAVEIIKELKIDVPIGFIGLSFKQGTDDVRNSPSLIIIKSLIKQGYSVKVYDEKVSKAILFGRNSELIKAELGSVYDVMVDSFDKLIGHAEIIVVAHINPSDIAMLTSLNDRRIIDLVGIKEELLKKKIINSLF